MTVQNKRMCTENIRLVVICIKYVFYAFKWPVQITIFDSK